MLGEGLSQIGNRAVLILGVALNDNCCSARSATLIGELFIIGAFDLAGTALDGALDVVNRHGDRSSLFHRHPKPRVHSGVATARSRRHNDLATDLGELLPLDCILLPL